MGLCLDEIPFGLGYGCPVIADQDRDVGIRDLPEQRVVLCINSGYMENLLHYFQDLFRLRLLLCADVSAEIDVPHSKEG